MYRVLNVSTSCADFTTVGNGPPGKIRDEASFWRRLSAIIIVAGLLLTTLVALLQRQSAERERDLRFEAEASRVAVLLEERIDERIGSFDSAISFAGATHPGPLSEYQMFMQNEVEKTQASDPGVMFFERVNVADLPALEAREAALGNDEFSATVFPGPTDERVLLTRVSYESELFGVSLLGLDATGLSGTLIPRDFGSQSFELYVLESADIFNFVAADMPEGEEFGLFSAVMVAPVERDGEGLGLVVSIMTIEHMIGLDEISNETALDYTLAVETFDEPIGASTGWISTSTSDGALATQRSVETAGLRWTVDVYASEEFAGSVGLFDQQGVWLGGVLLTLLAVLAAARRHAVRRSLDSARFELEHARTVASTDALTGLLNRNGLIDAARMLPSHQAATLFFIDLDGFKSVNDTEGHERGDQVLRLVANELRSIFRSDDLVSRFGGDEFVVFARRSAPEKFRENASTRITKAVAEIDARVTASVGIASRKAGAETDVKDLVRLADGAMYSAKRSGGNRHEVAV